MNKQVVALPYKKYGVQVYESGINFVVDIPRLGAQISYNGLSFSIRLPYQMFGNNTKGQCGESPTCFHWRARPGLSTCHLAVGSLLLCGQVLWHCLMSGPCEKPVGVSLPLVFPSCLTSGMQGAWTGEGEAPGLDLGLIVWSWCWLDGWFLCTQAPAPTILQMTASCLVERSSPTVKLLLTSGW